MGEANSLLATSTQLETKYLALPSYAERRNSMQLLEDAHVRFRSCSHARYRRMRCGLLCRARSVSAAVAEAMQPRCGTCTSAGM